MVNLLHTFEMSGFLTDFQSFFRVSALLRTFSELWLIEWLGFSKSLMLLGQPWYISRAVLRTVLNIFDRAFLQKIVISGQYTSFEYVPLTISYHLYFLRPPRLNSPWRGVRGLMKLRGFTQWINKKSSSEWCYYVRAEQTDLLIFLSTLPRTAFNTEVCSYLSLS